MQDVSYVTRMLKLAMYANRSSNYNVRWCMSAPSYEGRWINTYQCSYTLQEQIRLALELWEYLEGEFK